MPEDVPPENIKEPDPDQQPPKTGFCVGCGCTRERTWVTPNDGKRWCAEHLKEVLRRAVVGAPRGF